MNTVQSYVTAGQGILPNTDSSPHHPWNDVIGRSAFGEGYIIIFGINIASDYTTTGDLPQYLSSVTISAQTTQNFNIDSTVIINRSGTILGVIGGGSGTITIPSGRRPLIPASDTDVNAGSDFFVAIRTADSCQDTGTATFQIPVGGVSVTPTLTGDAVSSGGTTGNIVCELIIADLLPEEFDNVHSIGEPRYPIYFQWQPGEMIRPRYDHTPQDYQFAISPRIPPTVPVMHQVPQILSWETPTAVLAIGCAQTNVTANGTATPDNSYNNPGSLNAETLNSISLIITDVGSPDFDPNESLRVRDVLFVDMANPYSMPGITLWKDANNDGIWNPATDTLLLFQMSGFVPTANPREWTVTLSSTDLGDPIDSIADNLYDYFIVITLASERGYPNMSSIGGDFKIWIPTGGILFGPLSFPQQYAGIPTSKVKAIYNNIFIENLAQRAVDPTDPNDAPDLTSNVIPIFGMNIASGPSNLFPSEQIQRIRIDLLSYENVDPDDIAPLREDNYSGITLWRDNKNPPSTIDPTIALGNFDLYDTLIPCKFSSNPFGPYDFHWQADGYDASVGAYRYHTYMVPTGILTDPGTVYNDDVDTDTMNAHSGDDFFICLRTNSSLSYGSSFSFHIPTNEILLTGAKFAEAYREAYSSRITGNVFVKATSLVPQNATITPQSQPTQVLRLEITDNNSGKSPQLTGISVEFYNKGGFTLEDLASFAPVSPIYDRTSNWFNVQNLNPDALKQCGVVIYQGTASQIDWNSPVLIRRFKYLTSTWFDTAPGYQFEFQNPVNIPCVLYVVIRTSSSMSPGDAFSAGIVGWGATAIDWADWGSRAIPVIDRFGSNSNSFIRKQTGAFNFSLGGTLDLYATASFDGITLNWQNNTNVTQSEFISYEIWRTDSVHGETSITRIPVPAGWSASQYFDIVSRGGQGGLIDGVTYNYRLVMTYQRSGGQVSTIESNRVSLQVYGFPPDMTPSRPTAVASTNGIAIWFMDRSRDPYKATQWLIQRRAIGEIAFSDITIVDTVPTFYNPYIDTTAQFNVVYQYRVVARRQVVVPGATGTFYASSFPSELSDPAAIYGNDPGTGPVDAPSGGGGGCFIATAAFGTPLAKEINILRQFRDRILLRYKAGRSFVFWYYRHSPSVAYYISNHSVFKIFVRIMLYPLIGIAWILLHKVFLYLIFGMICVLMFVVKITKIRETTESGCK